MKWNTKTEFIDIETGEVLNPKRIKSQEYIIIKIEKLKTENYGNGNYCKNYRKICKRNNQYKLEL